MKTKNFLSFVALLTVGLNSLASVPGEGWQVSERGADHRKWTRLSWGTNQAGFQVLRTNTVVELATGLHRQVDGQWVESQPRIISSTNGAVCFGARHQVTLAPNLNTRGAVLIRTETGVSVKANLLGLAYDDPQTGQTVFIGQIKDCVGAIVGSNRVVFADAFSGVKADVRYTYGRNGFSQDVILRGRPPMPSSYGMSNATTRLVVVTEFIDTQTPTRLNLASGVASASISPSTAGAPELDSVLGFGTMHIASGRAFGQGLGNGGGTTNQASNVSFRRTAAVRNEWVELNGRKFLMERVRVREVEAQLRKLPLLSQSGWRKGPVMDHLTAPEMLPIGTRKERMLAMNSEKQSPGFVLDYDMVPTSSTNNFTFSTGTTYLVSGGCFLSGTTTIESGAVIKYDNSGSLYLQGPVTGGGATFTSMEDDSVGESLSTSSGNYWYGTALDIDGYSSGPVHLSDLTINYALTAGISLTGGSGSSFNNCSFNNCHTAFNLIDTTVTATNCSISFPDESNMMFAGSDFTLLGTGFSIGGGISWIIACDGREENATPPSLILLTDSGSSGTFSPSGPITIVLNPPSISISAGDKYASAWCDAIKGGGQNGNFMVARTGDTSSNLYVVAAIEGTAVDGTDFILTGNVEYASSSAIITIPSGESSVNITVQPSSPSNNGRDSKEVVLRVTDGSLLGPYPYLAGSPDHAAVMVHDPSLPLPASMTGLAGLVGWWRGETNALDAMGSYNGTAHDIEYAQGRAGKAFQFYGASYVTINNAAALNPTNAMTVETWVHQEDIATDDSVIISKDNYNVNPAARQYGLVIGAASRKFGGCLTTASGYHELSGNTPVDLMRWYHVAMTYDGTNMLLYVNGALDGSNTVSGAIVSPTCNVVLGASRDYHGDYVGYLYGRVDELGIYNRALTATQVQGVFLAGRGGKDLIDRDCDSLPDAWELQYFGNLSQTGSGSYLGDGVSNYLKWLQGRNPKVGIVADTNGITGLKMYTPLK